MNDPGMLFDGTVQGLRPEVAEFAVSLELKLRKNDHKKSWKEQPIEAHVQLLKIELMEFEVAKEFFGVSEMCGELLDIAAFALIIRDKLRTQVHNPDMRSCTCHPQDAPHPCQHKYALSKCWAAKMREAEPLAKYPDARNIFPNGDWTK